MNRKNDPTSRPQPQATAPGKITILGVDCATRPEKTGLAHAAWTGGWAGALEARLCSREENVARALAAWLPPEGAVLLAVDAPLGWPQSFKTLLSGHQAGAALPVTDAGRFFRRETDRFVTSVLGKRPMDVGSERIARTALRALQILEELRRLTGQPIPLAWDPWEDDGIRAIEVYPAGTLQALGVQPYGYKPSEAVAARRAILEKILPLLPAGSQPGPLLASADVLDAALCVLAGADFLAGRCYPPGQPGGAAQNEGWIWVRRR